MTDQETIAVLERRNAELKAALRDIAPLLLKAGFILPQHATERDRLIEKHDAVLSAALAAAGEGDDGDELCDECHGRGWTGDPNAQDTCSSCLGTGTQGVSGFRLPEQES